ncbi:MAG: lipid A deacylase LpxR family protein [Opitutales bacterium]|nr:lipid A deacylase LpxR family protein [Opitutales bacterium]
MKGIAFAFTMPACFRALIAVLPALLAIAAPAFAGDGTNSRAEASAAQSWTVSLYFENDLFFTGRDEDYTNGWKLSWISPDVNEYRQAGRIPGEIYRLFEALPVINQPAAKRNVVLALGHKMYTPSDIEREDLIEDDRPYAAWLYMSVALHNKTRERLDSLEVSLGVVGPLARGKHFQNFVHRRRGLPEAQGWDNQIGNEPGINLIGERKIRRNIIGTGERWGMDGIVHFGGSLGNVFTYLNAGTTVRAGWNLPQDFGASLIRFAGDSNAPAASEDVRFREGAWGANLFAGFDARAVFRDITLDGNTFRDSHSVDRRPIVGDFYTGFALVRGRWKFSYAQTVRTRTYENGRRHIFGSINVSRTF